MEATALIPPPAPSHSSGRSAEILASIRGAFAARGFEGTSMNDLARAAGMSVGNFYRYFPSKSAIVEALIAQDIAGIEAQFQAVLAAPDRMAALRQGIVTYLEDINQDDCRLSAEISATALRQSEISSACQRMEETAAELLLRAFALISGLAEAECHRAYGPHARYIVLVIRGFCQRCDPEPDPGLNALLLRGINQVLDDIAVAPMPAAAAPAPSGPGASSSPTASAENSTAFASGTA